MTISDASSTVSAAVWSEEQVYLKEFLHKYSLPAVVRIVKGQYCSLGPSGGPLSPTGGLQSTLLLLGLGKKKRIVAQSVKFKDNRKVVPVGPKLAIPATYDGYFDILSEDGRAVRCIESVAELSRKFPDSVLVRESFKAFVSKSDDLNAITGAMMTSSGASSTCTTSSGDSGSLPPTSRTVQCGESLILVGEVKSAGGKSYLRCLDANGENVYLPFDLKPCKLSAIAKEDNISGVHTAEKLLLNKRLPLMARLANGSPPVGLKSTNHFLPEVRLFAAIEEEYVVAMSLSGKDPQSVLSVPAGAVIKLQFATNIKSIRDTKEFVRLSDRCLSLSAQIRDRIVVHDVNLANRDLRINGADNKQKVNSNAAPHPTPKAPFHRRVIGFKGTPKNRFSKRKKSNKKWREKRRLKTSNKPVCFF